MKVILFLNTLLHADADHAAVSQYVERASVSYLSGSVVQIECEFKEGIERASCVVVFRDDGNKILIVKEYPQNTVFPVTLTVDGDPKNYTFAIFGKRGTDIDERPIVEGRVSIIPRKTASTSPTRTPSGMCGLMHGDSKVICHLCVHWINALDFHIIFSTDFRSHKRPSFRTFLFYFLTFPNLSYISLHFHNRKIAVCTLFL